ncbi:MAG: hypothetical protein IPK26_12605 [Planctomycetes bacterium]|nr:hypothetical protein [Planctomycetota bacterium]
MPAPSALPTRSPPLPRGAVIGSFIGLTAWAIALLLVSLAHGDVDAALQVGLPCLLLAMAMWAVVTICHVAAIAAFGPSAPLTRRTLVGALLTAIAILLWLVDRWAMPFLRGNDQLAATLDRLGTTSSVPTVLLWVPTVVAPLLLWSPLRAMLSPPRPH